MQIDIPDVLTLADLLGLLIQGALLLLIVIFIFIAIRIFKILGVAQQLAEAVSEIVETVNLVLWQPVRFYGLVVSKLKKFLNIR